MTPQEQDLLTNLVDRLRQSPPQQRDPDADAMISRLVREKPDTPYVLAQTVLIQDYALHQAQDRIAQLERQLQGQPTQKSGGFLDAIFGNSRAPQPVQQQPAPAPQPAYAPAGGPWGQAPVQPMYAQGGGQPSFLRSAATTAAGIAGGALLFEGIESLMGGHGGFGGMGGYGGVGGFMPQPGITETVVNNYYDNPGHDGAQNTDFSQSDAGGGYTDASYDTGSDSDFGGGDFGSDDV
jgi:hypothetical protein